MYGTVARFLVKTGMVERMQEDMKSYASLNIPGYVDTIVYQIDSNRNEYYMAVVFSDKDAYDKNANDPAQDARYREMLAYMDGEPEWHDGEIVYRARR